MAMTDWEVLRSISPSRDGLLIALRTLLTDELIQEMAEGDVDYDDEVARNKSALTSYRDSGIVPGELPWNPAEVCNLLRWDTRTDHPSATMRLFGSWILVQAYTQIESLKTGLVQDNDHFAIVTMAESSLDLGGMFPEQAARYFYWAYLALLQAGDHRNVARPFYLFGLLITAAIVRGQVSPQELLCIAQQLQADEQRVRAAELGGDYSFEAHSRDFPIWLLGLAGDDLNNFQGRCHVLVHRARAGLQSDGDEQRRLLFDNILAKWPAIRPGSSR